MKAVRHVGLMLLAVVTLLSTAIKVSIDSTLFPDSEGWMGGDAAYSIPLNSSRTVWLFGDSFVGKRSMQTMIHNSVGERVCSPNCQVSYWWGSQKGGSADSFFRTESTNYFWPLHGFLHGGILRIFLEQMHPTENPGMMSFDYSGVTLATVSNPFEPPASWRISYDSIARGNSVIPGVATVVQPGQGGTDWLYVFTLVKDGAKTPFLTLLRIPLSEFEYRQGRTNWQYLTGKDDWTSTHDLSSLGQAAAVITGNITEMSVTYHPETNEWLAIFPTPGFPTKTASLSTAKQLSGPWSQARPFFSYPEMSSADPRYTPQVFCYAAKEHCELEQLGELAFTYACNSSHELEIFRDARLYRPQLVRMPLPVH